MENESKVQAIEELQRKQRKSLRATGVVTLLGLGVTALSGNVVYDAVSGERARHFQQSYPSATTEEVAVDSAQHGAIGVGATLLDIALIGGFVAGGIAERRHLQRRVEDEIRR